MYIRELCAFVHFVYVVFSKECAFANKERKHTSCAQYEEKVQAE